jgi:hypothetical protein
MPCHHYSASHQRKTNGQVVPNFLSRTGLRYGELFRLWRCGYIPFSPGTGKEYPTYQPCAIKSWKILLPPSPQIALWKLAVFIRLWRKFRSHNETESISLSLLADIYRVLDLFKGDDINGDFVRQLISLLMLRDIFQLRLTHHGITSLLTLWPSNRLSLFYYPRFSSMHNDFTLAPSITKSNKAISWNLTPLSRLAGFTEAHDWCSTPTCTLRFAEVLAKVYSARATGVEQLLFFTAEEGPDDPYPTIVKTSYDRGPVDYS